MIVDWRKSSRSDGVDDKYCVEVARRPLAAVEQEARDEVSSDAVNG
jgi:Domain of unknown function (DUF397)